MKEIQTKNTLHIEFTLTSTQTEGMSGCGLWIINPPFILAEELKTVLNTLKNYFNPGGSTYMIEAY